MTPRPPRDPRLRVGRDDSVAREPTQPLSVDIEPELSEPEIAERISSLALGTAGDERTKVESPSGRLPKSKPQPALPRESKPPPVPIEEADARLGAVLGVYRLLDVLGKGGMGYVYRAEHVKLGREVALKLLRADYARRRDSVNRFFQEAKTVNRVRHRNIVDVTDFVELDDGTTYIIMELLRGQSLGKWARTGVDLPRALAVLVQICDGLGAAHAVGVIHRDLKPDNVIVTPTSDGGELVKLLDFGVAKLVNRDDEDIGFQTAAGSVIGTPAYMSPEQAGGMAVDQRSDIYSIGAIMYELFTGQPPFRGRSFGEYVRKHLTEPPVLPHLTPGGAGINAALEGMILRCLAKEPGDRYGHILELRDGLLQLLGAGPEMHMISTAPTLPSGMQHALGPTVTPVPPVPMTGPLQPLAALRTVLPLVAPAITGHHTPQPQPSMQLPIHVTPLAHQTGQALLQTGPMLASSEYSQYNHSQHLSNVAQQPSVWPWLAGGAVAVGLGITAAVWYANRGDARAPAQPATPAVQMQALAPGATTSTPGPATVAPTVAPAPAQMIELRFDSLPSGGVYADGRSIELCRTPCAFNVDLGDGGSTTKRTFVVRSDGYVDAPVDVDLTAPKREYQVALTRPVATSEPHHTTSAAKATKPAHRPEPAQTTAAAQTAPPPVNDTKLEPLPAPPPKPEPIIDPTDTHDPFKHH